MTKYNSFLYPMDEAHVRMTFDGEDVLMENLPEWASHFTLPQSYHRGMLGIFQILEARVPDMVGICVTGIWSGKEKDRNAPFCAFDLWVQTGPEEGFYLPMASAQSLFSDNGIPYYHVPVL